MKMCCFIFVNCCLIWLLKCKNICHTIYFSNNTIIVQVRYRTLLLIEKNLPVLDITGFFFRIGTQVTALVLYAPRPSPEYSCGKRNPLFPIWAASFVSILLYLIHVLNKYERHCHFSAAVS